MGRICLVNRYNGFCYNAGDPNFGFRPVVRLKTNIKIKSGEGSMDSPYILELI